DPARASAETLLQSYPSTTYAPMARFYLARLDIDAKQTAKAEAQLQQLVATSTLPTGMRGLARAALARLYLQQGKNQQVLQLLQKSDSAYAAIDWELRGDAQNALGKTQEALDDYRKATSALPATDPYLAYLQMKMANLGASG
ncbi:MAG: tetratricopeptide repeat protein, partial [Candidatus Igneacidithiobacillus chanchocoensis]